MKSSYEKSCQENTSTHRSELIAFSDFVQEEAGSSPNQTGLPSSIASITKESTSMAIRSSGTLNSLSKHGHLGKDQGGLAGKLSFLKYNLEENSVFFFFLFSFSLSV